MIIRFGLKRPSRARVKREMSCRKSLDHRRQPECLSLAVDLKLAMRVRRSRCDCHRRRWRGGKRLALGGRLEWPRRCRKHSRVWRRDRVQEMDVEIERFWCIGGLGISFRPFVDASPARSRGEMARSREFRAVRDHRASVPNRPILAAIPQRTRTHCNILISFTLKKSTKSPQNPED